jgi:3-isopropylmalate/(R)-2-methylmalate dehydratase small subunit
VTTPLKCRARVVGHDVNTDYIIASTRKRDTLDEAVLKRYLLETVDLVAGENFGCGSAMEIAATVILAAGIPAVLARSFSRTFFRNAINNGLIPIECDTSGIVEGDALTLSLDDAAVSIEVAERGLRICGSPLPPMMTAILDAGGLVPFMRAGGWR